MPSRSGVDNPGWPSTSERLLLAAAILLTTGHFVYVGFLFARAGITNDAELYFALGRSWLNGLTFYRDLFETKPPLVFLLAALSIKLTNGASFYFVLQFVLLALLAPLVALATWRPDKSRPLFIVGLLFGLTMAVETLHRSSGYEAEGFAILFATLPALVLVAKKDISYIEATFIAGCIAIAAMLKEPFLVSAVLAMFVVRVPQKLAYILLVTAVFCFTILWFAGCLPEYFSIYLPETISGRTPPTLIFPDYANGAKYYVPTPLWGRALDVYHLFTGLPIALSLFLFACLVLWSLLRARHLTRSALIVSATVIAASIVALHNVSLLLSLVAGIHAMGQPVPWGDPIVLQLLGASVGIALLILIAVGIGWCRWPWVCTVCVTSACSLAGLWIASVLIVTGGNFETRHFVFAFPPLIALGVHVLVRLGENRVVLRVLSGALVLYSCLLISYDYQGLSADLMKQEGLAETGREAAMKLDALMTECGIDRYLLADTRHHVIAAYTVHSPYQAYYGLLRSFPEVFSKTAPVEEPNPYFEQKMADDLDRTRLIVTPLDLKYVPDAIQAVINDRFTESLPKCAENIAGLRLYFPRSN